MELDPEVRAFPELLREIEALLSKHDQPGWATQIAQCRAFVERSDAYGLLRFLSLFGGMGSLNDVVLSSEVEQFVSEQNRFQSLLSRAYAIARRLEKDEASARPVPKPPS